MTKEYKLDIFEVISEIDRGNRTYYEELSDDQKKSISPYIIQRWISSIKERGQIQEHYLNYVNEYVNVHHWELSKHPELQWKLLCMIGIGVSQSHGWIPMSKKDKLPTKIENLLRERYPQANDVEISLMGEVNSDEELLEFAKALAWSDADLKSLKTDLKKRK